MDPLSIVVGSGGLLSLAIQVAQILKKYTSSVASAPELATEVACETFGIITIFRQLQMLLINGPQLSESDSTDLKDVLEGCVQTFSQLHVEVACFEEFGDGRRLELVNRLKWSFKESTISRILKILSSQKLTLSILLNLHTYETVRSQSDLLVTYSNHARPKPKPDAMACYRYEDDLKASGVYSRMERRKSLDSIFTLFTAWSHFAKSLSSSKVSTMAVLMVPAACIEGSMMYKEQWDAAFENCSSRMSEIACKDTDHALNDRTVKKLLETITNHDLQLWVAHIYAKTKVHDPGIARNPGTQHHATRDYLPCMAHVMQQELERRTASFRLDPDASIGSRGKPTVAAFQTPPRFDHTSTTPHVRNSNLSPWELRIKRMAISLLNEHDSRARDYLKISAGMPADQFTPGSCRKRNSSPVSTQPNPPVEFKTAPIGGNSRRKERSGETWQYRTPTPVVHFQPTPPPPQSDHVAVSAFSSQDSAMENVATGASTGMSIGMEVEEALRKRLGRRQGHHVVVENWSPVHRWS